MYKRSLTLTHTLTTASIETTRNTFNSSSAVVSNDWTLHIEVIATNCNNNSGEREKHREESIVDCECSKFDDGVSDFSFFAVKTHGDLMKVDIAMT